MLKKVVRSNHLGAGIALCYLPLVLLPDPFQKAVLCQSGRRRNQLFQSKAFFLQRRSEAQSLFNLMTSSVFPTAHLLLIHKAALSSDAFDSWREALSKLACFVFPYLLLDWSGTLEEKKMVFLGRMKVVLKHKVVRSQK